MKGLVIIPTYNEAENIAHVIERTNSTDKSIDILVIDDNSPDGTAEIVRNLKEKYKNIYLVVRKKKMGLGTAYIEGFKWAMKNSYAFVFEMDADLSHNPADIPRFLKELKKYDMVIGSRYIKGARIENWPVTRWFLSFIANLYARVVTGAGIKDMTSGYKCIKTEMLKKIPLDSIKVDGYGFQIEIDFRVWKKGGRIKEIPIVFRDRKKGVSKLSRRIIWQAFWLVLKLGFERFKKA